MVLISQKEPTAGYRTTSATWLMPSVYVSSLHICSMPGSKSSAWIRTVFQSVRGILKENEKLQWEQGNAWCNALWVKKHFCSKHGHLCLLKVTLQQFRTSFSLLLVLCHLHSNPERWQISAGVTRTQAGRRALPGPHAAPTTTGTITKDCLKLTRHSRGVGVGFMRIKSLQGKRWTPGGGSENAVALSGTSPCLSVCLSVCRRLRRLSVCGLRAHYQNKQRWGWKNGVHTLNKTGRNQTPAQPQGAASAGASSFTGKLCIFMPQQNISCSCKQH